jgi:hypothetical protein
MPNFFLSHKRVKVAAGMAASPLGDHNAHVAPDLRQTRRDPAGFRDEVRARDKRAEGSGHLGVTGAIER